MNIRGEVIEILVNTIVTDYSEIDKDELIKILEFTDDLSKIEFNSILYIKAVVEIEKKFDIEFDFEKLDYSEMLSLNELCKYIESIIHI